MLVPVATLKMKRKIRQEELKQILDEQNKLRQTEKQDQETLRQIEKREQEELRQVDKEKFNKILDQLDQQVNTIFGTAKKIKVNRKGRIPNYIRPSVKTNFRWLGKGTKTTKMKYFENMQGTSKIIKEITK